MGLLNLVTASLVDSWDEGCYGKFDGKRWKILWNNVKMMWTTFFLPLPWKFMWEVNWFCCFGSCKLTTVSTAIVSGSFKLWRYLGFWGSCGTFLSPYSWKKCSLEEKRAFWHSEFAQRNLLPTKDDTLMDRQWGHWRDQRVGLLQVTVKVDRSVSSLVVCYGLLRISKFDWACSIMGPIWAEENAMDNAATAAEHERLILKRKVRGVKPSDPENSLRSNSWHGVVKIYGSNRAHVWLMYIGAFRLLTLNLLDNARLCTCLLITLPANQWCTCQHSGLAIVDRSLSEAWHWWQWASDTWWSGQRAFGHFASSRFGFCLCG